MRAELGLPSVKGDDEHGGGMTGGFGGSMGGAGQGGKGKRPISVKFEIPYFTTSGIQVRYLKIIEPKVSAVAICALLTIRAFIAYAFVDAPAMQLAARLFCTLQVPRNGYSAVIRNLQASLVTFGPLSPKICCKIYGLSATRPGTVRWPADPSEAVLILYSCAL